MSERPKIHLDSVFARGLREFFRQLEARLQLRSPMKVWIAGGMAVNLYTGIRPTDDIDAEFSRRVIIPNDLVVEVKLDDLSSRRIWFDHNYNPMFALLHEDYQEDAFPLDLGLADLDVFVLTPCDLAVSKIGRFSDIDQDDIGALARLCLIEEAEVDRRAREALAAYPGSTAMIGYNLRDALAMIVRARGESKCGEDSDSGPVPAP